MTNQLIRFRHLIAGLFLTWLFLGRFLSCPTLACKDNAGLNYWVSQDAQLRFMLVQYCILLLLSGLTVVVGYLKARAEALGTFQRVAWILLLILAAIYFLMSAVTLILGGQTTLVLGWNFSVIVRSAWMAAGSLASA